MAVALDRTSTSSTTSSTSSTSPTSERLQIPTWIEEAFDSFVSTHLSTVSARGRPSVAPVCPWYDPETGELTVTTAVAFPQKAYNVQRNPHVSLLFSYPVFKDGAALAPAPLILVQGLATVDTDLVANAREFEGRIDWWLRWQPSADKMFRSRFWRWWCKYYLMRLLVRVRPTRILAWRDGDTSSVPVEIGGADLTAAKGAGVVARKLRPFDLNKGILKRCGAAEHGVLSIRERKNGPIDSVPCTLTGAADGTLQLSVPAGILSAGSKPRPAGVCFHTHDRYISQAIQQLLTGAATVAADGSVSFQPEWENHIPAIPPWALKFGMGAMTRAAGPKYFERNGLPAPGREAIVGAGL